jgi:competence protein ComEC
MLWIALAFSAGIIAGKLGLANAGLAGVFAGIVGAASLFFRRERFFAGWLMLGAFIFAGYFASAVEIHSVRPDRIRSLVDAGQLLTGVPVQVEGVLARAPELSPDGFSLTIDAERVADDSNSISASGRVRVYVPTDRAETSDFRYGDRVRIIVKLRRDEQFLNPGVIRQREILDQLRLDAFGSVRGPSSVERLSVGPFSVAGLIFDQRARAIDVLRQNLSPKTAGVMIASLLGNDQFLDKDTAELFREGGTYHLLVISGLHITVIGGIILLILTWFTRNRWLQFGITCAILWMYALAVGGESPVTRAALMFTVLLFGYAVRRDSNSLNLLSFTAVILLAWRPSNLFSPSFQLTFVSVAAVFALVVPLMKTLREIGSWTPSTRQPFPANVSRPLITVCEWLYWNPAEWNDAKRANIWTGTLQKEASAARVIGTIGQRLLIHTFEALTASAILQVALLPLSVVYFHRVSYAAIVNNLWAGVIIGIESFLTILGLVFTAVSETAASGFFGLAEICNRLLFLTSSLEQLGRLSFRVPEYAGPGRVVYVAIVFALAGLAFALHRWNPFDLRRTTGGSRKAVAALFAVLAVSVGMAVVHPLSEPRADGVLRVDFLDVGQGDSALVTFPDGTTMLVDAGGTPEFRDEINESEKFEPDRRGIGETVVSEYLWTRGYANIDYVAATHEDADHIGGMEDIIKNFAVGTAIVGSAERTRAAVEFGQELANRRVPVVRVRAGDRFEVGEVSIEVLNPRDEDIRARGSANNSSIVLRLQYRDRSLLLTGDIEQDVERRLAAMPEKIRADVVKVAHHGSKTSSTPGFVDAVRPSLAVISVGRRSQYGHPHTGVLENWRAVGANILTTGERGTVTVTTDGRDMTMSTYLP